MATARGTDRQIEVVDREQIPARQSHAGERPGWNGDSRDPSTSAALIDLQHSRRLQPTFAAGSTIETTRLSVTPDRRGGLKPQRTRT